jgi:hypothetical protein
MVFPARKRPDQNSDRHAEVNELPIGQNSLKYMWADYYALVAKNFKGAVAETSLTAT